MKIAPPSNGIIKCSLHSNAYCDTYFIVWPWFVTQTIYDNINGLGGTIYLIIFRPAGPFMYPADQISHYRGHYTESLPVIGYVLLQAITKFTLNVSLWRNPLHYSEDAKKLSQVCHMCKNGINVLIICIK